MSKNNIRRYLPALAAKAAAIAVSIFTAVTCCACGSNFEGYIDESVDYENIQAASAASNGHKIGVSMPTKDLLRWVQDGSHIKTQLTESGYTVDLQYADNDTDLQDEQIRSMIASGCEVLVIGAIDGTTLTDSLTAAKQAGVTVISYDRLITGSDAVSYYASFDNQLVGTLQGQYIADALDLEHTAGPYHLELFTGSPDDNNCKFFFGGAMEVLQPYMDEGKLVILSGQITKEECSIDGWSAKLAKKRMDHILNTYYPKGTRLDAVLSSNDSVALGIAEALAEHDIGAYPVLTGQDCEISAVKNIINNKQSMSVFKDTRILAAKTVEMIEAILNQTEVPVNDTSSYDNGTGIIPSFLCEPVFADKNNYQEILIDSGYYESDQLQ